MLKKIIQNLETGNYQIKYREYCDCRFYWHLNDGELECDIQSTDGDCWFDNALVMDDLALDVGYTNCYDLNKLTVDYFDGEIDDIDFQKTKWSPEAERNE